MCLNENLLSTCEPFDLGQVPVLGPNFSIGEKAKKSHRAHLLEWTWGCNGTVVENALLFRNPLTCMMLISLILYSGANFWGVSHREARSGCNISLEAEIWIQREENAGGTSHPPRPWFLLLLVFRAACWHLGSAAAQQDVSDFDVARVNILIGQQLRWSVSLERHLMTGFA